MRIPKMRRIRPTVATLERALHMEIALLTTAADSATRRIVPKRKNVLVAALAMARTARELLTGGAR